MAKVPCTKCGVLILPATSERNGGLCATCLRSSEKKEFSVPQPNGLVQVVVAALLTVLNFLWPFSLLGLVLFIKKQWARKVVRGIAALVLLAATGFALLAVTGIGTVNYKPGSVLGYQIPVAAGIAYVFISNIMVVLLLGSRNTVAWYEEHANK